MGPATEPEGVRPSSAAPRRPWVAALLSVLTSGLGHVYAGAPVRGAAAWALGIAVAAAGFTLVTALPGRASLAALCLLVLAALPVIALDAARVARKQEPSFRPLWYNRWYVYAAILVAHVFLVQPAVVGWIKAHVAEAYKLPSDAMAPTLLTGDFILAAPLRGPVEREQVVVHRSTLGTFAKRVVGLPGDTLAMREGRLVVNGRETPEPYIRSEQRDPAEPEFAWQRAVLAPGMDGAAYRPSLRTWGPLVLPPGQYFLLGDNRGESLDSRYLGLVPRRAIVARPALVYFSRDPATGAARWSRIGRPAH